MSRMLLHAVLQMPTTLWGDSLLDKRQRHARYCEASKVIIEQDAVIKTLEEQQRVMEMQLASYASRVSAEVSGVNTN
ncbi:hypothetical protein [Photobacterium kishitanii]|uniref:Uncharacterized protein n=1 Tax=Photobacterium kishitanii TaxID=318456 RepID=A0A2T3KMC1_9GAMM|nr:hypothetical protein [Photobacterium kishitanii]PSV00949.1 hypothetical protein C9J27_02685 [Photobacterium kishitanii]